ncbi:MAG: twin-arginine translocase TatA/TatE family subunit [Bacteroidales bacterium]|nr:twin-arginine translocase TatA/TatE family subunit [Bacteroidales bacterium]
MFGIYLFISGGEIIFILIAVVVLFGSKNLPEIARTIGKGVKQFKDAANDIKSEMTRENKEMVDDLKEIKKNTDQLKNNIQKYKIFEKDS